MTRLVDIEPGTTRRAPMHTALIHEISAPHGQNW
jgi:hypothetical protein